MKKKVILNRIIEIVLAVSLTVGMLAGASSLCRRKESVFRHHDFFEKKENYDVMFYGSSHMINGVFPNYLWRDYGISAYNFGSHADFLPSSYWVMRNTFDYVKPKLVVIDCYTISEEYKVCSYEFWHGWIDVFPMSKTKLEAIADLTSDPLKDSRIEEGILDPSAKGTTGEMIWDFAKYHSRWSELNDEDFSTPVSPERGAEARVNVFPVEYDESRKTDEVFSGNPIAVDYLEKMIEYCSQNNIEVLLVYLPFAAGSNRWAQANRAGEIASQHNLNYINFLDKDVVDYSVDFYDDTHLNTSGAAKITKYLGEYIADNYDIPDRHDDPDYAQCYGEYDHYLDYKMDMYARQETLHDCMILMNDDDFDSYIHVTNEIFWDDETNVNLLRNIGMSKEDIDARPQYIFRDSEAGKVLCEQDEASRAMGNVYIEENDSDNAESIVKLILINKKTERVEEKIF